MSIKIEVEAPDVHTGRAYNYLKRTARAVGFIELQKFLGVNHAQTEKAIRVLRNTKLIRQVGYDQKTGSKRGGPLYRLVEPNTNIVEDVLDEMHTEMVIGDAINKAFGHADWCMITNVINSRCTCKPKEQPVPLAEKLQAEPQVKFINREVEPPEKVTRSTKLKNVTPMLPPKAAALDARAKRIITEGEVLTVLQTVQEATSIEIAALLDVEGREQTNRVSMLCSTLFAQNLVGRSQRRNAGNGAFLYYVIQNAQAKDRTVAEIVTRPTVVETVTINDPYRALYMKSLYKRIVTGETLNNEDKQALALALGIADTQD